jgi:hypothetical protein
MAKQLVHLRLGKKVVVKKNSQGFFIDYKKMSHCSENVCGVHIAININGASSKLFPNCLSAIKIKESTL